LSADADIVFDGSFADWKRAARGALAAGVAPDFAEWVNLASGQAVLALAEPCVAEAAGKKAGEARKPIRVPRAFLELAADVACHRDEARWGLLYRVLWRLTHGEPELLAVPVDRDTHGLHVLAKAVHRDIHKMRAFVRFREVATEAGPWFVAWFEPQHLIVEANAPFFRDRFANMRWSILTPDRCVHWDPRGEKPELCFTPGARREEAPTGDAAEALWRTYYASIFNPARVKIGAMQAEMPRHYWKNLPEAALIPRLLAEARSRVEAMVEKSAAKQKTSAGSGGPADGKATG
jgi:DNA polymerase